MNLAAFVLALALHGPEDPDALPRSLSSEAPLPYSALDSAQDFQELDRKGGKDDLPFGLSAGIRGRYSWAFGSADRDIAISTGGAGAVILYSGNLSWADLFHGGFGTTLNLDILLNGLSERGRRPGYGRQAGSGGIYIALEHDEFSGDRATDDVGNSIHPDDLTMTTWIVGMLYRQQMSEGFFGEGRFGIGAVHYSAVDADFKLGALPEFRGSFLEDTWTFAMELRLAGGIRFGPVGISLGMGFRLLVPPNEGDSVDLSPGPIYTFDLELGAEIGF